MTTFNLKAFRKRNGISQQELADFLEIGQGYVSQMERGDRPIPKTAMDKITSNPNWIVEVQNMEVETVDNRGVITVNCKQEDCKPLPLVPREAISHPGTPHFTKDQVQDYYNVREFRDCDFLIRAKGDSMCPKYNGGDLVACRFVHDVLFFQWGRIYVVYTKSQGVILKRVQPSNDPDKIMCCPENPKYGAFEIPKADILLLAIVTGSISME